MTVQLCPVCKGCGLVPPGFYSPSVQPETTAVPMRECCRACGGRGVIQDSVPGPRKGSLIIYGPGYQSTLRVDDWCLEANE